SVPASGNKKERQAWIPPSSLAVPAVRSITACLIRYRSFHPGQGFPRSLATIDAASNCDREALQPGHVTGYWIFYHPVEGAGGRITDFHLLALPTEVAAKIPGFYGDPVMSDARGIVFAYNLWSYRETASNVFPAHGSSDFGYARIAFLRGKVRAYMQAHPPGVAPLSIRDVLDEQDLTSFHVATTDAGYETLGEGTNPFVIRY